ncbi:hypothetical protein [Selenomonas sp.]|nr:hypothetical protein [Selenomonas sp.]MDY4415402.1 hypothetical protein [Selenomonas sp.]
MRLALVICGMVRRADSREIAADEPEGRALGAVRIEELPDDAFRGGLAIMSDLPSLMNKIFSFAISVPP